MLYAVQLSGFHHWIPAGRARAVLRAGGEAGCATIVAGSISASNRVLLVQALRAAAALLISLAALVLASGVALVAHAWFEAPVTRGLTPRAQRRISEVCRDRPLG